MAREGPSIKIGALSSRSGKEEGRMSSSRAAERDEVVLRKVERMVNIAGSGGGDSGIWSAWLLELFGDFSLGIALHWCAINLIEHCVDKGRTCVGAAQSCDCAHR